MSHNGSASRFTSFCLTNDSQPAATDSDTPELPRPSPAQIESPTTALKTTIRPTRSTNKPSTALVPGQITNPTRCTTSPNTDQPSIPLSPLTNKTNDIPPMESAIAEALDTQAMSKCCCGQPLCAYWEQNNAALTGLERDLDTAARLGQVSLNEVVLVPQICRGIMRDVRSCVHLFAFTVAIVTR